MLSLLLHLQQLLGHLNLDTTEIYTQPKLRQDLQRAIDRAARLQYRRTHCLCYRLLFSGLVNQAQRPGQIHYQSGDKKYLYDANTKSFVGASKTENKRLLNDAQVQRAIAKGPKVLGEN